MKKAMLIFSACACLAFGQSGFLKEHIKVSQDGKFIGFATVLTPVEILSQNAKNAKVKVSGFVNENYQEKLVKDPQKYEEYLIFADENDNASFKGESNPFIKVLKKAEDEYGEIWLESELSFDLPSSAIVASPDELYAKAKSEYEQVCSACHHLHAPSEFSVSQWPFAIESMESGGFVVLEPAQKDLIIKYLQHNAKDAK
ncbi:hypothetical protein [Campylobacter sp. 19-13652]|uniref:hypothetical protein n=1 Tax=Campylobacter sp. 19-13652 TaxID=2840180 RepID=UPI001C7562E9|nr:hypothetical protein [Campylobacter sp. 19-13652]BCX80160.1 hypothetical protein LBC_16220 [Campylobacter sp. 19-13652]